MTMKKRTNPMSLYDIPRSPCVFSTCNECNIYPCRQGKPGIPFEAYIGDICISRISRVALSTPKAIDDWRKHMHVLHQEYVKLGWSGGLRT